MSIHSKEEITKIFEKILKFTPKHLINFTPPEKLEAELTKRLEDSCSKCEPWEMLDLTEFVLEGCVNTSSPLFLNQLYGGCHPVGLVSTFIVEKMNTNAHTYEAAPVFVLTEKIILKKLRKIFFGTEAGDGIFAPGGSLGNFYGMVLARHKKYPGVKKSGLFGLPPLVVFTSEESHYSISKSANWMGIGLENVVKVKTNKNGTMIVEELKEAIKKCRADGKVPIMVNSTAGTTVLGAFDPFDEIADVCQQEDIWFHCDACWGGAFVFSKRLREQQLKGIERCDSLVWNAHKMLGVPLQCSAFMTKYPNILSECNSLTASYLFQQDKFYNPEYDSSGDKSIQCGRKADAFKLWCMWLTIGFEGFCKIIEEHEDSARYIAEQIKEKDGFHLYLDTHQCTNVYFWYIPPRLRDKERTPEWWKEMGQLMPKLKENMVRDGYMMIGYSPLPHKKIPNALRLVIAGYPQRTKADMDLVLEKLHLLGKDL